ncbi:uncharacterized protein LOC103522509 [Diaphorina citri]|uniref:Uncharacterized protein LOC103522509 n=1 Tax=Diaphorina citri TaxID=121845 RepID=A0A3Q0JJ51_DIACI|nr:uncharacterized protein LOC103522509 [Diaphorina citri]KAI5702301.1 hypothetical protein M8J76_007966 [Diaphorina citri]
MKSLFLVAFLALIAGGTCDENTTTLPEPVIQFGATRIIEILTVIDTDQLKQAYQSLPRSTNPDLPTHIGREYAFMITTRSNVITGQATADLNIKAIVGDTIKWSGTSESNNIDHSIIIYDVKHSSNLVGEIARDLLTSSIVYPKVRDIRDIATSPYNVFKITANIRAKGRVQYLVRFAMYEYSRALGRYELFGYFTWDPAITVV